MVIPVFSSIRHPEKKKVNADPTPYVSNQMITQNVCPLKREKDLMTDSMNRPVLASTMKLSQAYCTDPLEAINRETESVRGGMPFLSQKDLSSPYTKHGKGKYISETIQDVANTVEKQQYTAIRHLKPSSLIKVPINLPFSKEGAPVSTLTPNRVITNTESRGKIDSPANVLFRGQQTRNQMMVETQKNKAEKVGGCKGTRYGCCPDGITSKMNESGSNCRRN